MAFFEELGNKISQAGQSVAQKTKGTTGVMKLNGMIADEEKRINLLYTSIGKKYFELHSDSAEPALQGFVNEINTAKKNIADYNEQIKRLKGFFPCPNCGNDVSNESAFCPSCGLRMMAKAKACCTNCGESVGEGKSFCTRCGARVAQPVQVAETPTSAPAPIFDGPRCTNCGEPIKEDNVFCIKCGTRVEKPVAEGISTVVVTPDVEEAPAQVEKAPVIEEAPAQVEEAPAIEEAPAAAPVSNAPCCTNCGEAIEDGAAFCINCGMRVGQPVAVEETSVEIEEIPAQVEEAPAIEETPVAAPVSNAPCCTNCGEPIDDNAAFCINCGTRVAQPAVEVAPTPAFCTNCGYAIEEGSTFCVNCGTKLR